MALFLGIHDMGEETSEDVVQKSWSNYKTACQKHHCQALRVHYNASQGKAFCLTEAALADDVRTAHNEINLPLKDLVEVKILE